MTNERRLSRFRSLLGKGAKLPVIGLLLVGAGGLIGYESAVAGRNDVERLKELGPTVSLDKIIEKAKMRQPGRLIEVELEESKGRMIYEIEILDEDARVWELEFDAKTGEFLKREEEIEK